MTTEHDPRDIKDKYGCDGYDQLTLQRIEEYDQDNDDRDAEDVAGDAMQVIRAMRVRIDELTPEPELFIPGPCTYAVIETCDSFTPTSADEFCVRCGYRRENHKERKGT